MFPKSMKSAAKAKVPTTPGAKPYAHPSTGPKHMSKGKTGSVPPRAKIK